jgi:hypothetical protein
VPIAWTNDGSPAINATNLNKLAVVDDVATPGTPTGDALRAAYVALGQMSASPDLMAVGTITRSSTGAATGFSVTWPDGATGTYTGTESAVAPGAIDSYTVTHVANGTTTTYTQPALTRDPSGNVTARPAMTVA